MKKSHLVLLGLAVCLFVAGYCGYIFIWVPDILVAKVKPGMAANAVSGSLTVQAEYALELKSDTRGRVLECNLDLDKHVKAGEVLLRIDSGDLELEIEKLQVEYEAAKKGYAVGSELALQLESAKEALTNAEDQQQRGILSMAELIRQRRSVQGIEQKLAQEKIERTLKLETYENTLKARRRQLEKMTVVSPFDGIVTQVFTRKGDLIDAGAPLARIISIGRLVEARLSEENIAGVKVGQKAMVTFLPYGMFQWEATVAKKMSSADPETQRYPVFLEVKIEPEKLMPGITGEASIILDERSSRTNVPRTAVFGDNLYVVKNGKIELRTITKGYESMTAIEVLKGVEPDELVVIDKLDKVSPGMRISPVLTKDTRWR